MTIERNRLNFFQYFYKGHLPPWQPDSMKKLQDQGRK